VEQTGEEKFARYESHAACRVELVYVRRAVRIDAGEQWRDGRDVGEVVPVHNDAGGLRHRGQVERVVGGAARRHQADDGVDDRFRIDDLRHEALARLREIDAARGGGAHQRLAQRRVRVDEGRAGQMEAHQLHHHLVGVGRAVEGARPG
jgi:hypothetical protein